MWSRRHKTTTGRTDSDGVLVLSVDGMHCGSCGLTIDDVVEDVPGVARATTSFRSGLTEVLLEPGGDRDTIALHVLSAVAEAGYRAAVRPT